MRSIEILGKKQLVVFFGCAVLAVLLIAAGGFFAYKGLGAEEEVSPMIAQASCVTFLRAQGFEPEYTQQTINVYHPSNQQMEDTVHKAGLAIAYCAEHELKSFCAGSGCEPHGLSFSLRKK